MRLVQILFFVILMSCNNGAGSEKVLDANNESGIDSNSESSSSTEATGEKPNLDPLLGGPAEFEISINGASSTTSYLIGFVADGHFRVDSSTIQNGKIAFKRKPGFPQGLYYVSYSNSDFVQVILGEDQKFTMQCDVSNVIETMNVKGSHENQIFYDNLKYEEEFNPQYMEISSRLKSIGNKESAEYKKALKDRTALEEARFKHLDNLYKGNEEMLFVKFKRAGQNPNIRENGTDQEKVYFYRKEFWDNVDFKDKRLIRTPVIHNKLKRYFKELTPQQPDSIISAARMLLDKILKQPEYYKFIANWVAIQYEPTKTDLMDPEAVFVNMIKGYFTRERAFWADSMEVYGLQQRAGEMAQSLVGKQGPDVISTNQFGEKKSIYEMKADFIIVYLYNPTCEHCMKETPLLVDWYNKNKANNKVDVFAIAIDTDDAEWKAYIKKNKMNFTNVHDPTNKSIYGKYYVDITPEVYVLNKQRKIVGKNLKVFQIDTIIEREN